MQEIWKTYRESSLPKTNKKYKIYEVSNFGRVKRNGELVTPIINNIYFRIGGFFVHRAVAELFVQNPQNKKEVDHIDGNSFNNNADNLRWVTHSENMKNPYTANKISNNMKNYHLEHPDSKFLKHNKGKKSWNSGIKYDEEKCKNFKKTDEHRRKISNTLTGTKQTKERVEKTRNSKLNANFHWLNDSNIEVYVPAKHWHEFIDIGFSFGRIVQNKK